MNKHAMHTQPIPSAADAPKAPAKTAVKAAGHDVGAWRKAKRWFTQERIVLSLAFLLFALFSVVLPGFATHENILALVRSVSVLGILGLAMAVVVIGRGIDLSMVATMAISVAWTLALAGSGLPLETALLYGLGCAVLIGVVNGILVAYAEIPALFSTLSMGTFIYGFGRLKLIPSDVVAAPEDQPWFTQIGQGEVLGVPMPVLLFVVLAVLTGLFLRHARAGRFVYAMGDNYQAARITGIPVRPMIVLQYGAAALIGFLAGVITAASVASMNTRIVNSTLIYDVILVVVLGGIGLSGGKGGVRNVIVGTLLIGILLNGMTIMDVQYTVQNVVKSSILLAALIFDSLLNPRDEQTAQQGDI
ncbi:MAG: ABC transporter permease [Aquabacterium sp.]|jgi:ribose transport system permease protein|uniref:ABC transporter permease n=1 Tax=Aquabacterium sp. TaxID=1872578 RepID=UPI003BB16BA6